MVSGVVVSVGVVSGVVASGSGLPQLLISVPITKTMAKEINKSFFINSFSFLDQ